MQSNDNIVEARLHHMHHVLSAQHTYVTDFFLKMWDWDKSIEKCILQIFRDKFYASRQKTWARSYFQHGANKGLI